MCFESMAWAVKQSTANSGQKLVLLMLADFANSETGQCNPSHAKLAERCCMSVASIKRHIDDLAESGFLEKQAVFRDNIQKSNQYRLNIPGSSNLATPQLMVSYPPAQDELQNLEIKPRKEYIKPNAAKPDSVSEEVWQEFVAHRKRKKGSISALVLKNIEAKANIAGWTLEQAMAEMVSRNWQGFEANWVASKIPTAKQETPEERRKRLAFM